MRAVLLADTHVPRRARDLPAAVWEAVTAADLVVHAGDWVDRRLLTDVESCARRVVGVAGNNDGFELRARLPEVAEVEVDGLRLAVLHDTGPSRHREQRMRARFPAADLLVFGHSHIPWDTAYDGLRLLNPGSPTDRRRQPAATYMTAEIEHGCIAAVQLHRLPR